jgi:hypothetical protein
MRRNWNGTHPAGVLLMALIASLHNISDPNGHPFSKPSLVTDRRGSY